MKGAGWMPICVVRKYVGAAAEERRHRGGEHGRDMDERLANPELEGENEGSGVDADLRREEGPDPEEPTETIRSVKNSRKSGKK